MQICCVQNVYYENTKKKLKRILKKIYSRNRKKYIKLKTLIFFQIYMKNSAWHYYFIYQHMMYNYITIVTMQKK